MTACQQSGAKQAKETAKRQRTPAAVVHSPVVQTPASGMPTLQRAIADPGRVSPTTILALQRACGNRAVTRLVQSQASAQGSETSPPAQRQKTTRVPNDVQGRLSARRGSGSHLPAGTRTFMEGRFGASFGDVRTHTDGEAVQLAGDLQAQAFTHGQDIYFGAGKYDPGSNQGKHLLAHELTHVIQQDRSTSVAPVRLSAPPAGIIQRVTGIKPLDLLADAGPSTPSSPILFQNIWKILKQWVAEKRSQDRDPRKLLTLLNTLREHVAAWRKKYGRKIKLFARSKKQKALDNLAEQIEVERPPLITTVHQKALEKDARLEKDDKQHREGWLLGQVWNKWVETDSGKKWLGWKGATPQEFYTHVTQLEDNLDPDLLLLVKGYVYSKIKDQADQWLENRKQLKDKEGHILLIPRIEYLQEGGGKGGRDQYKLQFDGVGVSYEQSQEALARGKHIYVMSSGMDFYAKPEERETQLEYHHSSFLEGGDVAAAGAVHPVGGGLIIDLESGHYHPELQHLANALLGLKNKAVPLAKVSARPLIGSLKAIPGHLFFRLARAAKIMAPRNLGDFSDDKKRAKILKNFKFDKTDRERVDGILNTDANLPKEMRALDL